MPAYWEATRPSLSMSKMMAKPLQLSRIAHLLETVSKQLGQKIVEVLVNYYEVAFEVCWEFLDSEKDLPKTFFYQRQLLSQLDVTQARNHVVRHAVVLVAEEDGELEVRAEVSHFHELLVSATGTLLAELDLPVNKHPFH